MAKATAAGVISANELYTLPEFKRRMGLTEAAYREMKARGFRPIRDGKRAFISGRQAIEYYEKQADD